MRNVKCGSFLKYVVLAQNLGLHFQQVKVFHYSACRRQNCKLVLVEELVRLFCSNYWQNPSVAVLVIIFIKILIITFTAIVKCTFTVKKLF